MLVPGFGYLVEGKRAKYRDDVSMDERVGHGWYMYEVVPFTP
jgi:hypothetical protein